MSRSKCLRIRVLFLTGLAVALLPAAPLWAAPPPARGYRFDLLQTIPSAVPGELGAAWTYDFEPGGINNNGEVVYTGGMTIPGAEGSESEGVFLQNEKGAFTTLAFPGDILPDGNTYAGYVLNETAAR